MDPFYQFTPNLKPIVEPISDMGLYDAAPNAIAGGGGAGGVGAGGTPSGSEYIDVQFVNADGEADERQFLVKKKADEEDA